MGWRVMIEGWSRNDGSLVESDHRAYGVGRSLAEARESAWTDARIISGMTEAPVRWTDEHPAFWTRKGERVG